MNVGWIPLVTDARVEASTGTTRKGSIGIMGKGIVGKME